MPNPKLTPAQLRVLRELCKPGARAHYMSGPDAYWFIAGTYKRATAQVMALIELGLLKKYGDDWKAKAHATPAAHALLAELAEKDKDKTPC